MMESLIEQIRERQIRKRGGLDWCGRSGHPFRQLHTECGDCLILAQMFWWIWEDEEARVRPASTRIRRGH
jgi:hypothetical protein